MGRHLRAVPSAACRSGGFIVSAAGTKQSPFHDFLSNEWGEINLLTLFQMFKQEKPNIIYNRSLEKGKRGEREGLLLGKMPGTCYELNEE